MATRLYLSRRLALLVSNLDQIHKEIKLVNDLLHDLDRELAPTPLGGLTSSQPSLRMPNMPTPLREVANAMEEVDRVGMPQTLSDDGEQAVPPSIPGRQTRSRNASGSYFPVDGMSSSHTIPIMHDDAGMRKKPALANSKSEADLRGKVPPMPIHPALRPAVDGQGRYPKFKKLVGYKDR
jgi:hypothetical protein